MTKQTKSSYPNVGEIFALTLNGRAQKNQPMAMFDETHYLKEEWEHKGKIVRNFQTRNFMLVYVGYAFGWKEFIKKLKAKGKIPEGQWARAFRDAFPNRDDQGPVGAADGSWKFGGDYFPYINHNGSLDFMYTGQASNLSTNGWRWLVEVIG